MSMAAEDPLAFGAPSPAFLQKHGTLYCAFCGRAGLRTQANLIPMGGPKRASFKKAFACCEAHLEATRKAALRQIEIDQEGFDSEAGFSISRTFGI